MTEFKHCDEVIDDFNYPVCLRYYLLVNRLPAIHKYVITESQGEPVCFATYQGEKVRLIMASRFGHVGIAFDLSATQGYDTCVYIEELSNFTKELT